VGEWSEWASGDCVHAPDRPGAEVAQAEILRRVAVRPTRRAVLATGCSARPVGPG